MKKVLLNVVAIAALVTVSFTSCEKTAKATEDAGDTTVNVIEDVVEVVDSAVDSTASAVDSTAAANIDSLAN
ncbi:MAG: hypothetical protein H6604_01670 [Flavobacteriales bacterium]|nr:hypothetical protein [Flavobacteriales bacterium]